MVRNRDADWEYGELSSRVYQLDKPVGTSLSGDVEFYTRQLAGVTGRICEPAVGTGRILIPLLEQGLRVTGYDTSEHMLRICRDNCAAAGVTADVHVDDMIDYRRPGEFDAILVPTGSIILLPDRDAVATALRNMHDSLAPGGRLYIDVPPLETDGGTGPLRHWWDGESELLTLDTMHVDVDRVRQRLTAWQRYELWRNGRLVDTQLQLGVMHWFGVPEFTELLRAAGFDTVEVYGDYRVGEPVDAEAQIWTFQAIRS